MNNKFTIYIEIPGAINQQELWNMEKDLTEIEGVEVDLQEAKDLVTTTLLILNFTAMTIASVATIGENIQTIYKASKVIYNFLHKKKSKAEDEKMKKVVFTNRKKKIEVYNLSIEEIVEIIKNMQK